jgi:signal transduction histidine kinase
MTPPPPTPARTIQEMLSPRRTAVRNPTVSPSRSIAAKLGTLSGALVLVLVVASTLLLVQAKQTAQDYDRIFSEQVRQSRDVREIQLEFKRQVQEWNTILLRGSDPTELATHTANFRRQEDLVSSLTDDLIGRVTDPQAREDLIRFRTDHKELHTAFESALADFVASEGVDFAAADRLVGGRDEEPTAILDAVVVHISGTVTERIAAAEERAQSRQRGTIIAGFVAVLLLVLGVAIVVRRIVGPIRGLTAAVRQTAEQTLPSVITAIKTAPPDAEPPALPRYRVRTHDELRPLAEAFTQVQDSAVRLAREQHQAEREAAEMLINLGRRNQNLLSRLLAQVSDLERTEQDPDSLAQLFRLDHAVTRIRRNAESMLVLAGAKQTRAFSAPVPVEEVIRAALSEIEEYARVDLYHIEDGQIAGAAAADVVHLLAELIENATHFSPPHTQVTVVGQRLREGYRVRVLDQGVGMTRRELDEANERILRAVQGRADSKLLGLYVVGRLATRRGIQVTLEPSAAQGITATVIIPAEVLAEYTPAPVLAGARSGGGARPSNGAASMGTSSGRGSTDAAPARVVPLTSVRADPAPAGPAPRRPDPAITAPVPAPSVPSAPARSRPVSAGPVRSDPHPAGSAHPAPDGPTPVHPDSVRPDQGWVGSGAGPVSPGGTSGPGMELSGGSSAPGPAPAMPRRVRGAQLAGLDLGEQDLSVQFTPAPQGSRLDLRRFQRNIAAARSLPEDLTVLGEGTDGPPGWADHPEKDSANEEDGDRP